MFKSFSLKLVLIALTAIALTACTTFATSRADTPVQLDSYVVAALPVVIAPIEIQAPILEITERPIRARSLSDRAYVKATPAEVKCMALAIYHESKSESAEGQAGVGYVVLNRIADGRFGNTACTTVYQKNKGRCQFDWHCKGAVVRNQTQYNRAERVALGVINRTIPNPIGDSLFFHATYVNKSKRYANEIRIGGHRFYGSVARI